MTITLNNLADKTKIKYAKGLDEVILTSQDRPTLKRIKINPIFESGGYSWAVKGDRRANVGHTFSTAVTNAGDFSTKKFAVPGYQGLKRYYHPFDLDALALMSNKTLDGAFVTEYFGLLDDSIEAIADRLAIDFFGNAAGALSTIHADTDTSTTTLKLANARDAIKFHYGDEIVFAASTASALRSSTGLTVSAVDPVDGELTLSATPDSLSASIAAGDSIFIEGTYVSASDTLGIYGLEDWAPATVSATSFLGVDRSSMPRKYAGYYKTGDASNVMSEIRNFVADMNAYSGARPDVIVINPDTSNDILEELRAENQRAPGGKQVDGASGYVFETPTTRAEVIVDHFAPVNQVVALTMKDWELIVPVGKKLVNVFDEDGSILARRDASDAVQIRPFSFCQLICRAPGHSGRLCLS